MKLDLNKYTVNDRSVERMTVNPNYIDDTEKLITAVVAYTNMPVLAACVMLGKYLGYTDELVGKMLRLQAFYKYDVIGGIQEYSGMNGFPKELLEICDD